MVLDQLQEKQQIKIQRDLSRLREYRRIQMDIS